MCSPGINGERELRGQPANPGSPGKMAVKMECVCVCVLSFLLRMLQCLCCICVDCRTDCIFSPDDKLVITGTSVKKGEGVGKLVFLDRQTLKIAAELDVAPQSASSAPCYLLFLLDADLHNFILFLYLLI